MKQKLWDLHTHSIFSDGTYSPEQIIDSAVKLGFSEAQKARLRARKVNYGNDTADTLAECCGKCRTR